MKMSKYNRYTLLGNDVLIYNTLYENFSIIEKERLEAGEITNNMIALGIALNEDTDEDSLASYKLSQQLHNNDLNLTILASESCNFKCKYCFDCFDGKNIDDTTVDNIVMFVRRNIANYSGLNISWFGGEPLLAKDKIIYLSQQLIHICRQSSRRYSAAITTNGSLLETETFRALLHSKIYSFEITIDGPEKNHNYNRPYKDGSGSFQKIINNLRDIRDKIKSRMFQIVIRINMTKSLHDNIVEFCRMLIDEFGSDNRFAYRLELVYDWGGERIESMKNDLLYSLRSTYETLAKNNIYLPNMTILNDLKSFCCGYARDNSYTIMTDGSITICPQINKSFIGKLTNGHMDLNEQAISKWYTRNSAGLPGCSECAIFSLCQGKNCPANLKAVIDNNLNIESMPCKHNIQNVSDILTYLYLTNRDLFVRL